MTRARIAAITLAALAASALTAPCAEALTVSRTGPDIVAVTGPGEENMVYARQLGTTIEVWDIGGAAMTAGAGCTTYEPHAFVVVSCPSAGVARLLVTLGDRNDHFSDADPEGPDAVRVRTVVDAGDGDDNLLSPSKAAPLEFHGGPGADRVWGTPLADVLDGGPGWDELNGWDGDDALDGGDGDDRVYGGKGDDQVRGGPGNDEVNAWLDGTDTVDGEDGWDWCALDGSLPGSALGVHASLNGVADDGPIEGSRSSNLLRCEGLHGTNAPDVLIGDDGPNSLVAQPSGGCGQAVPDVLRGLGGDDELDTGCGSDAQGGSGDDLFYSRPEDDALDGGPGRDTVRYLHPFGSPVVASLTAGTGGHPADGETDTYTDIENLYGGPVDDELIGDGGDNVLTGGGGWDELHGGGGADTADLTGNGWALLIDLAAGTAEPLSEYAPNARTTMSGFEHARGGSGDDILVGDSRPNRLMGGHGDDLIDGGAGDDVIDGEFGEDTVTYEERLTAVSVDLAAGVASVGGERDALRAVEGAIGGSGPDLLVGGPGSDLLAGGAGDDTIDGGPGEDELHGDEGTDRLLARDGALDDVHCNGGTATVDAVDFVTGCSIADEPPAGPPQPARPTPVLPQTPGFRPFPGGRPPQTSNPETKGEAADADGALRISLRAPRSLNRYAVRRGSTWFKIRCSRVCRVRVDVAADRGKRLLRRSASLRSAQWRTVRLRSGRRGLAVGRGVRRLRITIRAVDRDGRATTATHVVRLRER